MDVTHRRERQETAHNIGLSALLRHRGGSVMIAAIRPATYAALFLTLVASSSAQELNSAAGGFQVDSRKVFDFCSPDQIADSGGVRVEWGRYQQWTTHNGTAFGPGTFLAAPWNTCLEAPDFTTLEWKGQGKISFQVRGARDGPPKGRNVAGAWSDWIRLGDGNGRVELPPALDRKPWIQVKCELGADAKLTEFSIHRKLVLPDHPRMLLTPQRIRDVKERIAGNAEVKRIYDLYITTLKNRARQDWVRTNTNSWTAGYHMISLGIAWNLSKDPVFLEEARRQLDRLDTPWAKNLSYFENPQLLGGAAILVDHVWNGLSEDERRRHEASLLFLADKQQNRWRFSDVSNQIFTNSGKNVLTGIALAGAGIQPDREAFYFRQAEDLIRNHLIPGSNFWASDDGGWGEGHGYCSFTQLDWAFEAHAWASASGEDIFQLANFFKFLTQWRVYERRYDGTQAKFNDSGHAREGTIPFPDFVASRWRDRIAQKMAKDVIAAATKNPDDFATTHLWQAVLWHDPDLATATETSYPETMPLGRHFAGVGHVVSRSGWGPEDVWTVFKSGNAYTPGTHYHADENSFVIDRGGALAIDSGTYDSESSHYGSYFTRSVAHNTVTVMKPGERFASGPGNDGGQIGGMWEQLLKRDSTLDSAQWGAHLRAPLKLDGIVAFETNRHFTYSVGDASKAYSKDKVSQFTRQFLHLRPDIIVVFDRVVSTEPDFEKRWLLHTMDEPEIRGSTAIATHLRGKLFSQTLLPADARIGKVGGPDKEFFTDGQNHPVKRHPKDSESGGWRVEVFPGAPRKEDFFLHFLYVTDSATASAPSATLTDSADRCALKLASGGRTFTVSLNKSGPPGGHVRIDGPGVPVTQDLTTKIQPQRLDTEDIWK
jgi:heparin/heparan-sulfate lyase